LQVSPGEVTDLLLELKRGNRSAEDRLIPLVYAELRRIAAAKLRREHQGHSLQPTALVHEAYLRLTQMQDVDWESRSQFFALAAKLMRNVLVDHARSKQADKRPHGRGRVELDNAFLCAPEQAPEVLELEEALNKLTLLDPRLVQIVELRFYAGMTEEEISSVVGKGVRTIKRDWQKARAWLYKELKTDLRASAVSRGE